MDELSNRLSVISICISVFTFIFCIPFVRNIKSYFIPLLLLVTAGCIADTCNFFFTLDEMINLFVFRAYTLIEFTLLVVFYFLFYREYFKAYPLLFVPLPMFYLVCFLDYRLNGADSYDNLSLSFEAVLISIYALFSFWMLMKTRIFKDLSALPFFYINSGILLYFLGNFLFFVFSNLVFESAPLWDIHSLLSILFNFLIVTAFWKSVKA
jgi:hypothetical protein